MRNVGADYRTTTSYRLSCGLGLLLFVAAVSAHAETKERTLYSFCKESNCSDGVNPEAGLIVDVASNLYGTTFGGGDTTECQLGLEGCGTVFKLASNGTETVLYTFCTTNACAGGANPDAGVIEDKKGNLYGTTSGGGNDSCGGGNGCGTVFKLARDGVETVLHAFCSQQNCADGAIPKAALVADKNGNLYGTTSAGGDPNCGGGSGCGTVFKLAPDDTETVLYAFTDGSDGGFPFAGLITDSAGNLYGTATVGGADNYGVIFEVSSTGGESVLYAFKGGSDGDRPLGDLIKDKNGNLYGTTSLGGGTGCGGSGCGTVFELSIGGNETVLHAFQGGNDGAMPQAQVTKGRNGDLYGTTLAGGGTGCGGSGCGTVFELATTGTETVLHAFAGSDGNYPHAGLIADKLGHLFGTTAFGGAYANGTVFRLKE